MSAIHNTGNSRVSTNESFAANEGNSSSRQQRVINNMADRHPPLI
jgi:hypothetical protein